MKLSHFPSTTLALSLLLAACGQQTPPATIPAEVATGASPDAVLRREGQAGITAAEARCTYSPNEWGHCNSSAPLSQYRFFVKCYDDGIANRYSFAYGVWRNNGGTYRSYASCPAGDIYQTFGFEWR
ncbi:hypothetical protein [Deinococcus hohokamensis]|uniref:Lipoprotein n=1 Tax=Deinococcus hohokamensis TaxID=309883 RepID=A0ABV9IDI5_9DEIO